MTSGENDVKGGDDDLQIENVCNSGSELKQLLLPYRECRPFTSLVKHQSSDICHPIPAYYVSFQLNL